MVHDGVERLRSMPGVVAASATAACPQGGYGLPFVVVGAVASGRSFHGGGGWVTISPKLLRRLQDSRQARPRLQRRDTAITRRRDHQRDHGARFWEKGDPLNDRLVIGRGVMREFAAEPERQIIGVVGDVRNGGLNSDPGPMMPFRKRKCPTLPTRSTSATPISWVVRTQVEPRSVSDAVQEQLRQASGLPVSERQDHERGRVDLDVAPAVQHVADDGVWRLSAPCRDRDLRADGVFSGAADAGDRHPAGARRAGDFGEEHDRPSG